MVQDYAVYKLKDAAKAAAQELIALEQKIMSRRVPQRSVISPQDHNLLRRQIMDEIKQRRPDLIAQLGLDKPAIQIEQHDGGYPRAYNHYPHLGELDSGETVEYLILCPADYKGDHHVPDDAERIPDDEVYPSDFGDLVYRGRGMISPPLVHSNKAGTTTPADFDPENHACRREGIEGYSYKVFIAGGASLACVKQYLERKEELENARKTVKAEIEKLAPNLKDSLLNYARGDDLKANCFFEKTGSGKTEVWLQLANKSRNDTAMIKDNDHFTVTDFRKGAVRVKPADTEAGKKLQRLFDRMLSEPDLGQYWQIHNPTASGLKGQFHSHSKEGDRVPKLDTVRGVHYLVYLMDKSAEKDHCNPPGGIPVNLAEYLWLKADIKDEQEHIRLPEPPAALSHMRPVKAAPAP